MTQKRLFRSQEPNGFSQTWLRAATMVNNKNVYEMYQIFNKLQGGLKTSLHPDGPWVCVDTSAQKWIWARCWIMPDLVQSYIRRIIAHSLALSLLTLASHPLLPLANPHAWPKWITIFFALPSHTHTNTQFPEKIALGDLLILLSFSQINLRRLRQLFLAKC